MFTRLTRSRIRVEDELLGVRNYLNKHFAMYTCLTRSRIHVELASPIYTCIEGKMITQIILNHM